MENRTRNRGFASMDAGKQREIARKGGRAAHEKKTAHQFTPEEAREAGRKGGQRVSANRNHMAEIGRVGGKTSAARRQPTGRGEMNAKAEMAPEAGEERYEGMPAEEPSDASA
jgi:general stress protein YciG